MLDALDHVVVAVGNLEAASRDTEALLGRPASWRGEHPGAGTANVLFRLENTVLELLTPAGAGPVGAAIEARLGSTGEGMVALAFGTRDAAACAGAWRAAGLKPRGPEDGLGRDSESGAIRRWSNVYADLAAVRGVVLFAIERRSPPDVLPLCEPRVPADSALAALDHAVVHTADVDASRVVYAEQLGLRLALDRSFEARGVRILFFRVGGVTVEVVGPLAAKAGAEASDRYGGLAWRVGDPEAARARVAEAGFDVSEVRAGARPGTRVCTVRSRTCGVPTLLIGPEGRVPQAGSQS